MPPFYPPPLPVPDRLETAVFTLEPLTPAHVTLDYAALMAGKEMLRTWSGSPWPQDDFTLDDNRADLQWHWDEQQARIAFTYTVLNPARTDCLGCVYIKPLSSIAAGNETVLAPIAPQDALVRFWVTAPHLADGLDARLLALLMDWLRQAWRFQRIFFHTRHAHAQQLHLFNESALRYHGDVQMADRGSTHALFLVPA